MAGGIDWVVLIPSIAGAVGFGTFAGSVITTYGGRGRERRKARSKALADLEEVEVHRLTLSFNEGPYYDFATFAKLNTKCMIAGVPRPVLSLYDQICYANRRYVGPPPHDGREGHASYHGAMASLWLADQAAQLIRDTLWHPRLILPFRWWRTRRLRRKVMILYGDYWQGRLTRVTYRTWIKAERRGWGDRRAALRAAKGALSGEIPVSEAARTDPSALPPTSESGS
jgi:hypothetical protein